MGILGTKRSRGWFTKKPCERRGTGRQGQSRSYTIKSTNLVPASSSGREEKKRKATEGSYRTQGGVEGGGHHCRSGPLGKELSLQKEKENLGTKQ